MKNIHRKNNNVTLVVLNEKGHVVNISQLPDSNRISQEQIRQSRIKFNLASTLIAVSATFCFTGIAMFWTGNISEEIAIKTVDLVSKVVTSYCLPLLRTAKGQLNELAEEEENDT